MDRRNFIAGIGGAACLLAGGAKAAQLKSPSDLNPPKNAPICKIKRRVFKVGDESRIEIEAPGDFAENLRDICIKRDDGEYQFVHQKAVKYTYGDGKIIVDFVFPREDSYIFYFYPKGKNEKGKNLPPVEYQRVYALDSEMFALRPFKGDTHMHTRFSDGRETVEAMGARCLQVGFGFQAVSDHRKYLGSQTLCKIFNPLNLSMKCFLAEECHQDPAPHVHSVGAKSGVTEYIAEHREAYDKRVDEIVKELPDDLSKQEALSVARAEAEFDVIRFLGGISGLNHPYWRMGQKSLHLTKRVVEVLCKRHKFDTFELVNGSCGDDSTDLAVAQLSEMRADGCDIPIVGVSDAHQKEPVGTGYTMAFAKSNRWEDIRGAIMSKNAVVVEVYDKKLPRIYGRINKISYAYFLYQYFFPAHDALCLKEAEALRAYLEKKSPEARKQLAAASERVRKCYVDFFGG